MYDSYLYRLTLNCNFNIRLQLRPALMHYGVVREKDVVSNYENLTRFELNSLQRPFLSLLNPSFQVKVLLID